MGYYRAGFDVIGVDIDPMPDYPFEFIQADAMTLPVDVRQFQAIHASPPCQFFSAMQHIRKNPGEHPDLVAATRKMLDATGLPYVIENVKGAPLASSFILCGSSFGLNIIRHRLFETKPSLFALIPPCDHSSVYDPWHGKRDARQFRAAMGIDWMRDAGGGRRKGTLAQAIPPAYTEYIGKQLIQAL